MLCFCYAKTLSFFFASDPLVLHGHSIQDMLPSGGLFAFWDRTHPSLPLPQSRSAKKKGGSNVGIAPGNRLLASDYGITGFPDLKVNPGLGL